MISLLLLLGFFFFFFSSELFVENFSAVSNAIPYSAAYLAE